MSVKTFPQNRNPREQAAQAARDLGADLRSGRQAVVDRIGRPLQAGDLVQWRTPYDLFWRVVDAVPMLDPGAAPGAIRLRLEAAVPMVLQAGQRMMEFTKIPELSQAVEPDPDGETPVADPPPETH